VLLPFYFGHIVVVLAVVMVVEVAVLKFHAMPSHIPTLYAGAANAYAAQLARDAGAECLYLSGSGGENLSAFSYLLQPLFFLLYAPASLLLFDAVFMIIPLLALLALLAVLMMSDATAESITL
jgi:hypothetical protein